MKFKACVAVCVFAVAASTGAEAQSLQPAISSAWDNMQLSQGDCLARGRATFERMRFTRIEAVGYSVFADFGNYQFAFRCIPEKQLFYVYGGGPGDKDKELNEIITDLKSGFNRR